LKAERKRIVELTSALLFSDRVSVEERKAFFELLKKLSELMLEAEVDWDGFPKALRRRVEEKLNLLIELLSAFIYDEKRAEGGGPDLEEFKRAGEAVLKEIEREVFCKSTASVALVILERTRKKLLEEAGR